MLELEQDLLERGDDTREVMRRPGEKERVIAVRHSLASRWAALVSITRSAGELYRQGADLGWLSP